MHQFYVLIPCSSSAECSEAYREQVKLENAMNEFYVYMLLCGDGTYYVGQTDNIEKRMNEHISKTSPTSYTSKRMPIKLVFVQTCVSRDEAFTLEQKIKRWSHKKKQALIVSDWNTISQLAKKQFK